MVNHTQKAEERMKSQDVGDDEFNDVNAGDPRPLIEEGIYPALWAGRTRKLYAFGEKLIFTWNVFTTINFRDPAMRNSYVSLPGYYNVKRDKGEKLVFGPGSSYRKDWIAANSGKHPQPRHALPLSVFRDRLLFVQVTTVTKDTRGPLHRSCYWSKVQRIFRPLDEDEIVKKLPLQLDDIT